MVQDLQRHSQAGAGNGEYDGTESSLLTLSVIKVIDITRPVFSTSKRSRILSSRILITSNHIKTGSVLTLSYREQSQEVAAGIRRPSLIDLLVNEYLQAGLRAVNANANQGYFSRRDDSSIFR